MKHLIDRPLTLAECARCQAYVFAGTVDGTKVAADIEPLDVGQLREAILSGAETYDLLTQGGRPWKLRRRGQFSKWPPTGGCTALRAHGCGAAGQDARKVETAPLDPRQAPAMPGSDQAGHLPVAVYGRRGGQVVEYVNPHRSDIWRCQECKCRINAGEMTWGIQWGSQRWAVHDSCKVAKMT